MAIGAPRSKTAFERLRRNASMAQPGADALAEVQTVLADNDDGLTFKTRYGARVP
jgi:hypothetical protein